MKFVFVINLFNCNQVQTIAHKAVRIDDPKNYPFKKLKNNFNLDQPAKDDQTLIDISMKNSCCIYAELTDKNSCSNQFPRNLNIN